MDRFLISMVRPTHDVAIETPRPGKRFLGPELSQYARLSMAMIRRRLFVALRSILTGWGTLLLLACLLEHPLLRWAAPILGVKWLATAGLALDCIDLAATGWMVGRLNRPESLLGVLTFAATLTLWDFTPVVAINIPWLLRLAMNALRDSVYWSSLLTTAASQALLFGSLLAGGLLSRAPSKPVSIMAGYGI